MQIKKISFLFFLFSTLCVHSIHEKYQTQYIVVLDPSGDAKRTGRKIGDNFERGLTLQCAEKIKEYIEQRAPTIKIIITRMPGDVVYDLQNASLTNRLNADLFINLNFYYCQETKPTLYMYQFSYGNDFASYQQGLAFHTYDQAYTINRTITDEISQRLKEWLSQQKYQSLFTISGIYKMPIKPLIGVVAPSIAIEAGLKNKELWIQYVEPLAQGIIEVLE